MDILFVKTFAPHLLDLVQTYLSATCPICSDVDDISDFHQHQPPTDWIRCRGSIIFDQYTTKEKRIELWNTFIRKVFTKVPDDLEQWFSEHYSIEETVSRTRFQIADYLDNKSWKSNSQKYVSCSNQLFFVYFILQEIIFIFHS